MTKKNLKLEEMPIFQENVIMVDYDDFRGFFQSHPKRFPGDCGSCEMYMDIAKKEKKNLLYDIYTGDIIGIIDRTRELTSGVRLNLRMVKG